MFRFLLVSAENDGGTESPNSTRMPGRFAVFGSVDVPFCRPSVVGLVHTISFSTNGQKPRRTIQRRIATTCFRFGNIVFNRPDY